MSSPRVHGLPASLRDATLSTLLDDPSRAISLLDLDGHVLFANGTLCDTLGLPPDGAGGMVAGGRHAREVVPSLWTHLEPVFDRVRGGFTIDLERSSGAPACASSSREWAERWRPVRDEHGRVIAILGSALDVTAQRAERDEQQHLADLRGRLIETASHELRGPLASVLGFAHRLTRRENLPPEAIEAAGLIREQAQEMAFRLDLLLGLSELDNPSSAAASGSPAEEVRIDDLLAREAEALRARRPSVALDVHCPQGVAIASNPHYIRQIVANLLDNAAKYGSGWIGLVAEPTDRHLVIRVEDDGDGIRPEEQAQVFTRGYRSESARTQASTGWGLGLFVARELAERLGGTLSLRSDAGVGATFLLRIPLEASRKSRRRLVPV